MAARSVWLTLGEAIACVDFLYRTMLLVDVAKNATTGDCCITANHVRNGEAFQMRHRINTDAILGTRMLQPSIFSFRKRFSAGD